MPAHTCTHLRIAAHSCTPVHPSSFLCTHLAPIIHPATRLQERLLELVQSEAEGARPTALLSREAGVEAGAPVAIRDARQRNALRAQLEVANGALRRAMAALDAQGSTLTLHGEVYAEKMRCDEAVLERCPDFGPGPNR